MDAAFDGNKTIARDNSSPSAFIWNLKLLLAASPHACHHVNHPLTSSSSQPIENESVLFSLRPHPLRPAPAPHLQKPLGPSPAPRPCHHPLRASSFQTLPALAPPPAPRLKSWKRPTRTSFRACKIASGHCQLFPFALVEPGQQTRNDSVSIISVRTLNRICPFPFPRETSSGPQVVEVVWPQNQKKRKRKDGTFNENGRERYELKLRLPGGGDKLVMTIWSNGRTMVTASIYIKPFQSPPWTWSS